MRSMIKLIAYAIIAAGAALIAAALAEAGVLVFEEFTSSGSSIIYGMLFFFVVFTAPIVAAVAIGYLLYKLFRRHGWVGQGGRWALLLVAALAPVAACSTFLTYLGYASQLAPFPAPYPGVTAKEVWREIGHGQYNTHTYEYTADVSLTELKDHYQNEMPHYCANDWQFTPTQRNCQGYVLCLVAECEIPRPLIREPQLFTLYLRSISEMQTNVQYHIRSEGTF